MLSKILGNRKSNDISTASPVGPGERKSRALKIVHAKGHVERYYMAAPAAKIIQKHHPSFVLARPEIFRRPWDSVVRPDEILFPGQKYYVVPRRTVDKLRRRIRKPGASGPGFSSTENDSLHKDRSLSSSFSGILVKPGLKVKARNLHVRFLGLETTNHKDGPVKASSHPSAKKSGSKPVNDSEGRSAKAKPQKNEKKRRARIGFAWEPALPSITE